MNATFRCIFHQSLNKAPRTLLCHQSKTLLSHTSISPLTTHLTHHCHLHQTNNSSIPHHPILFNLNRSFTSNESNTKPNNQSINNTPSDESNTNAPSAITNTTNSASTQQSDDSIDRRAYPIAFSSLLMGIGIGVILPVMPQFANEVGINTMQYGLIISVMGITRLIMNVPAALLTDKFGRKSTLVGGPIISSLGTLIMASAHSLNDMICSRFVVGAGGSLQMAGAQAYLSDISTIRNRARTMAPLMIGFSAGATLGPFIGGFLCDYYESVRIPFVFVSLAIATVALNNMYSLPETLKKEQRIEHKTTTFRQTLITTFTEWKYLTNNTSHMSGVMVHTAFWFTQAGATFTLMPLFATNDLGVSATQIGGIFAMMSVVNICGAQLFAKVSDKFGRKKVIVPAICILSCIVPLIPHVTSLNELYYLMFVYSIGSTMLGTSPTAYIADIHSGDKEKEQRRSQALAMLRSGGDCGLMLGSGFLGYLTYASGSFMYPMCTASLILFASGANFAINAKETIHLRA